MYEVIGESVKSAISIKLGEIFGNSTKRYKEKVTKMQYPNFFIYIVNPSITPNTQNRWHIDYLVNIKYRVAEDTTNVTNLQQQLDDIAFRLMTEFTEIQFEKVDGVLEFMFNLTLRVQRQLEPIVKQEKLKLNEEVIE